MTPVCACCRDLAPLLYCAKLGKFVCMECLAELEYDIVPDMESITSRRFHVPRGVMLRRPQRQPGIGEGHDQFGNHT